MDWKVYLVKLISGGEKGGTRTLRNHFCTEYRVVPRRVLCALHSSLYIIVGSPVSCRSGFQQPVKKSVEDEQTSVAQCTAVLLLRVSLRQLQLRASLTHHYPILSYPSI